MDTKEIKINCPEGFEIDKENSTFECIKFKPVKKLPKTWEEYCKTHPRRKGEFWINEISTIAPVTNYEKHERHYILDKNILPNKKYAKAMLALCQLIQLRDCYNDGWIPDWNIDSSSKYCIKVNKDNIITSVNYTNSRILTFKTRELCIKFITNFKDLIVIAKPLL
jgi:hypothetical protein